MWCDVANLTVLFRLLFLSKSFLRHSLIKDTINTCYQILFHITQCLSESKYSRNLFLLDFLLLRSTASSPLSHLHASSLSRRGALKDARTSGSLSEPLLAAHRQPFVETVVAKLAFGCSQNKDILQKGGLVSLSHLEFNVPNTPGRE